MDAVSLDPPASVGPAGDHSAASGLHAREGRVFPVEVATLAWMNASGEWLLTVVCKATFDLSPPVMRLSSYQAPISREDQRGGEADGLVCPSDLDPLKKRVDVTLVGHCFAPERGRVSSLVTRIKVGSVDKRIEVVGKRSWKGGELTKGEPFDRMSLGYENSAGGQSTSNPAGIPATSTKVPLLQPPGGGPKRPGDRVAPIGCGPVAREWPQRKALLRRRSAWTSTALDEAPMPSDIDERFFNSAPIDQQLDEILPDEAVLLENLHPRYPRLETRLPGLAPHAFVERPQAEPELLSMRLDTLCIDTDRSLCVVLWRAQVPISDPSEPGTVLVALGRAKDQPSIDALRASAEPRAKASPRGSSPSHSRRSVPPPPPRHARTREAAPAEMHEPDGDLFANTQTFTGKVEHESTSSVAELANTSEVPAAGKSASGGGRSPSRPDEFREEKTEPPPPPPAHAAPLEPPPPPNELTMTDGLGEGTAVLDASPAWLDKVNPFTSAVTPPPIQPPPIQPPPIQPPSNGPDSLSGLPFGPGSPGGQPPSSRNPSPVSAAVQAGAELAAHGVTGAPGIDRSGMAVAPGVDRGYLQSQPSSATPALHAPPSTRSVPMPMQPLAPMDAVSPRRSPAAVGEVTDLIWFDPSVAPRLRSRWGSLVDDLEFSPEDIQHDLHSDDPQECRDHHNTFGVLTRADAEDGPGITAAMKGAVGEGGRFTPPLVLVVGTMRLPFSELEMLKATSESMAPLAPSDKKLKELLDEVNELLATPLLQGGASVATSLTRQLREQFAQSTRSRQVQNLDDAVERVLLEERRYQMRKVFGGTNIRSLLMVPGDSEPIVAYVPEQVGPMLPLANEMRVRAIAEAHMRQDRDEKRPIALRVLALGRVNRLD